MSGNELNQGFSVVCKKAGHSILNFHIPTQKGCGGKSAVYFKYMVFDCERIDFLEDK